LRYRYQFIDPEGKSNMKKKFIAVGLIASSWAFWWMGRQTQSAEPPPEQYSMPDFSRLGTGHNPPSRKGYICGLLPVRDAVDLTQEPAPALYEFSSNGPLRDTPTALQEQLFIDCRVQIAFEGRLQDGLRILVLADGAPENRFNGNYEAIEKAGLKNSIQKNEYIPGGVQEFSMFSTWRQAGRVLTPTGGYLVHLCDEGGRYIIGLTAYSQLAADDVSIWKTALQNLDREIEKLGGCAEPNRLARYKRSPENPDGEPTSSPTPGATAKTQLYPAYPGDRIRPTVDGRGPNFRPMPTISEEDYRRRRENQERRRKEEEASTAAPTIGDAK
jgi:hypothetical protein